MSLKLRPILWPNDGLILLLTTSAGSHVRQRHSLFLSSSCTRPAFMATPSPQHSCPLLLHRPRPTVTSPFAQGQNRSTQPCSQPLFVGPGFLLTTRLGPAPLSWFSLRSSSLKPPIAHTNPYSSQPSRPRKLSPTCTQHAPAT